MLICEGKEATVSLYREDICYCRNFKKEHIHVIQATHPNLSSMKSLLLFKNCKPKSWKGYIQSKLWCHSHAYLIAFNILAEFSSKSWLCQTLHYSSTPNRMCSKSFASSFSMIFAHLYLFFPIEIIVESHLVFRRVNLALQPVNDG